LRAPLTLKILTGLVFYAGLGIEGATLSAHAGPGSLTPPPVGPGYDFSGSGVLFSGTVGMNAQQDQWIYGAELSVSAGDLTGINDPLTVPSITVHGTAAVRGRVGYSLDQFVLFGTGSIGLASASAYETHAGALEEEGSSRLHLGAGVGVGIDYAVADGMIIRGEIEHFGYAPRTYSFYLDENDPAPPFTHTHDIGFATTAVRVSALWQIDP
jgi:outer membrane immunogenic protein